MTAKSLPPINTRLAKDLVWHENTNHALDCKWVDTTGIFQISEDLVLFVAGETRGLACDSFKAGTAAAQERAETMIRSMCRIADIAQDLAEKHASACGTPAQEAAWDMAMRFKALGLPPDGA